MVTEEHVCRGTKAYSKLLAYVDHAETYGPTVMPAFLQKITPRTIVDLGAGSGRDLHIAHTLHPQAQLHAIECMPQNIAILQAKGIQTYPCNLESDPLPFANESVDLFICNQVIEHTKEIFYIFHEMSRCLTTGGNIIIGVPNIASLHNRIGLLLGKHPTQSKACSAHVRCFSKNDFLLFLEEGFPQGYVLKAFAGSQFYPFPRCLARPLSRALPSFAFSIFFLSEKTKSYTDSFLTYPRRAMLETNFKSA